MQQHYYEQDGITLYHGDCREVLRSMPEASIDTVITDPPYELGFMGKSWDSTGVAFSPDTWRAVLRVCKPGAIMLAFGGTRTYHRIACAIEDAGWEIRDCIMWIYSGFPKSLNISKAVEKADGASATLWTGWGTALKPAYEPIIVAMKPLNGTFAENALRHGVAGLNIDGGRIETNGEKATRLGRWPANVIFDEEAAAMLDEQSGTLQSGLMNPGQPRNASLGKGGYMGSFPDTCTLTGTYGDSGGASRFFYTAKASTSDRGGKGNNHPTVKPIALMKYLCNLTATPTGGKILDPFAGSGTTLIAAREIGRACIGVELEEGHCRIIEDRLAQGVLFGVGV